MKRDFFPFRGNDLNIDVYMCEFIITYISIIKSNYFKL